MVLAVSKCFLAIRDSILNDDIRELIMEMGKDEINTFESYINFLNFKGWLEEPPLYKSLINAEARVASNEIWHLWELLENRYITKQQTKYFISNVIDRDFQLLLSTGINILESQINKLEEMLLFYGINLPDKMAENIPTPESKERITDQYIFNILFIQMNNAATLHGFALEEIVINPDIRGVVKEFLFVEMELIDKVIKYGKLKGWVPLVPQFRSS